MRFVVVLPDGVADVPVKALGNRQWLSDLVAQWPSGLFSHRATLPLSHWTDCAAS